MPVLLALLENRLGSSNLLASVKCTISKHESTGIRYQRPPSRKIYNHRQLRVPFMEDGAKVTIYYFQEVSYCDWL